MTSRRILCIEQDRVLMYDTASRGSLAQLVEHRAFNPMVIGSNPIRPTININRFNELQKFLLYCRCAPSRLCHICANFLGFAKAVCVFRQMLD